MRPQGGLNSKWREIITAFRPKWLQVALPNSSIEVGFLVLVPRMPTHQELEPTSVPSAMSSPVAASTTSRSILVLAGGARSKVKSYTQPASRHSDRTLEYAACEGITIGRPGRH